MVFLIGKIMSTYCFPLYTLLSFLKCSIIRVYRIYSIIKEKNFFKERKYSIFLKVYTLLIQRMLIQFASRTEVISLLSVHLYI